MTTYFSKVAAIHANQLITSTYEQPHAVQQEANLDYILARIETYAEDSLDEREKLVRKAALLMRYLAYEGHVFADGNKRTTFALVQALLELNGFEIPHGSGEAETERAEMMKETAIGKHSLNQVRRWLERMVRKKL